MKRMCLIIFTLMVSINLFAIGEKDNSDQSITVYAYDSFVSEWGPGAVLAEMFKEQTGITVNFEAPGDAVTVMSKVIMEKENPKADVVIGIDNNLVPIALEEGILSPYKPKRANDIRSELLLDDDFNLTPYDWGFFAICYDTTKVTIPPTSLEDLTDSRFEDSIVLIDPRTSTPGMGFLLSTVAVYGDDWPDYWERLKPSIITIADGWSSAYGLFTNGESDMVLSYSTSPVYHVMWEETDRYQAVIFEEGNYVQIEGMGVVEGTDNRDAAEAFIDFMLSEEAQRTIAEYNIMFPAIESTELPEAFNYGLKSDTILRLSDDTISNESESYLQTWSEVMVR